MALTLILAGLVLLFVLALLEARLIIWGAAALGLTAIWQVVIGGGFAPLGLGTLLYVPGILMVLLSFPFIRRSVLTAPIYRAVKKNPPQGFKHRARSAGRWHSWLGRGVVFRQA